MLVLTGTLGLLANGCSLVAGGAMPRRNAVVGVEHFRLNRCGAIAEHPCRADSECPTGPCVSVLPSDAGAFGRDGGHTIAVGDRVLWIFGDTFTESGLVTMTAGWSDGDDPLSLRDVVDGEGRPAPFLAFTSSEQLFNVLHAAPPECCFEQDGCPNDSPYCHCPARTVCTTRVALWPGDGTATGPNEATWYYDRQIVGAAPYDFTSAGVGVATIHAGASAATRALDRRGKARLVFTADEPSFTRGLRIDEEDGAYFYAYATVNRQGCAVDVLLARVPVAQMAERARFRFWDGSGWAATLADAEPVVHAIAGGLGTVVWNEHLGAYLSLWSDLCTGGNVLMLRVAPAPQGPWSDALEIDIASLGASPDAYYGMTHPEFGREREILVSYFQPLAAVYGQMRLLRIELPATGTHAHWKWQEKRPPDAR